MRRSPSASSMTERTFRSPSPGRTPVSPGPDVPPVPSIPKTQRPRSAYASSTTIQTQPFATASEKLKSGKQGSWFGAAKMGDTANVRTADSALQRAATTAVVSEPRPGSVSPSINSINFSYPRARHDSPAPSNASTTEVTMVYDANSRRMVPMVERIDLMERQQSVKEASEKPVKKKKQGVARSGSHFAKGTVGRTVTAPVETLQSVSPAAEAAQTTSQPKHEASESRRVVTRSPPFVAESTSPRHEENAPVHPMEQSPTDPVPEPMPEPTEIVAGKPVAEMPAPETTDAPILHKKPSTVLEEPEGEANIDASESVSKNDSIAIDAVPVRSPPTKLSTSPEPSHAQQEYAGLRDSVKRTRVHSESPARSPGRAHFAPATPIDKLAVRHEPPPRSVSPRKSALKQSSSLRDASPSDDSSVASGSVSALSRDDPTQARKKSVRVSFNEDHNVVLGESAEPQENESPVVLSPQVKHKPWRSFMSRNKKESSPYDEEETMSPRPALPLFGSVREKKAKEPDNERPLVRPAERAYSPPASNITSPGTSTDSAIGSILLQESAIRNEANISKMREPLPPVVQSIEGNGYISSSSESSDDEPDNIDTPRSTQTAQSTPSIGTDMTSQDVAHEAEEASEFVETQQSEKVVVVTSPQSQGPPSPVDNPELYQATPSTPTRSVLDQTAEEDRHVPSISVQSATPPTRVHVPDSPDREYFDVPGGFPSDTAQSASSGEEEAKSTEKLVMPAPPIAEPTSPPSPTRADMIIHDIAEEEESSEHSSIYSDAYEDLSDVGADGFMSLDAVLESSPTSQVSRLYEKTLNESKAQAASNGAPVPSTLQEEPIKTPDDWDTAKAYWRSLTVDKRRQLEKEAIEEAGEEADQEASPKPKKARKRKSVDRQSSLLKNAEFAPNPERVYQIQAGTTWAPDGSQVDSRESSPPAPQTAHAKGFRKSMRAEQPPKIDTAQPPSGAMRKTLRSNGSAGDARASMPTATSTAKAARPASYHIGVAGEPPKSNRKAEGRPVSSSGLASAGMKPTLRRRGSDSSESSFRRSRANAGEGFGFRRSMRTQPPEPESPRAAGGSGRFSIRSLSPTGSPFRRSTPAPVSSTMGMSGGGMRTSLRAAPADPKSRFATFGRSSGKKAKKDLGGSRFADSSDEDNGGRLALSSTRFADSSDEDDGYQPPVRTGGFAAKTMRSSKGPAPSPAKAGGLQLGRQVRSDSPDLPDSDDDARQAQSDVPVNGHARPTLQRSRSGRGSLTAAQPAVLNTQGVGERPGHHRRGSFISSILRRKKDSGGKISRDVGESAARRDTRLERDTNELAVIRSNSGGGDGRPRLQKRGPSWPLPDAEDENSHGAAPSSPLVEPQRPATASGGPTSTASPRGFLQRRSLSAQQVPPVPAIPKSQVPETAPGAHQTAELPPDGSLKKKKFGTLRKIFGLND